MKYLSLLFAFILIHQLSAQNTIPNGGFENWTTVSYDNLDNYDSEQGTALFLVGRTLTTKDTGAYHGNYAVRMETEITANNDTVFGFITSGSFSTSNGFPYSQQPDSIVGYYKCDIQPGDSAILITRFSNLGNIFSFSINYFTGIQNTWTRFSFPLSVLLSPDSAFFGAASSNAVFQRGMQSGSWLMLDSVAFVGTGVTQQLLNGDFENWTIESFDTADDWASTNLATTSQGVYAATKTMDNQTGTYALRLETIQVFDDTIGLITNGEFANDSLIGGQPFSIVFDTLIGQYKYSPVGLDSAAVFVNFNRNGTHIGGFAEVLLSQSTYTQFEVPFVLPQVPDTMRIDILSSINQGAVGSTLFIDDLKLKSIITSLDKNIDEIQELSLFPNPAKEEISIRFSTLEKGVTAQIIDGLGRVYAEELIQPGQNRFQFIVSELKSGAYYVRLRVGEEVVHRSFIKE